MTHRQLGQSGLRISTVSLGTWLTIGQSVEDQAAHKILDAALDHQINVIDTADIYNRGQSEQAIGRWMKTRNRDEFILATKAFGPMSDHWMTQGLSLRHLQNAVDASLIRLQTDVIDLYQCHRYDVDTPLEETCFAMNQLIQQGKVRYWGVSQWSAVQILRAVTLCLDNGWRPPISNQPIYNMLNRGLEVDVMDVCEEEGLGLIVYSPLAQGLLSGKYTSQEIPAGSRLADETINRFFPRKRMTDEVFAQLGALKSIAGDLGITMSQLALAWCLRKEPVTSVIMGASKVDQVAENAKAADVELSDDVIAKIEETLGNQPVDQYTGTPIGHGIVKRGY